MAGHRYRDWTVQQSHIHAVERLPASEGDQLPGISDVRRHVTAMAVFVEPCAILESEHHFCTVELRGEFTRGQMVVDRSKVIPNKTPNVEIVVKIDTKVAEALLDTAVKAR